MRLFIYLRVCRAFLSLVVRWNCFSISLSCRVVSVPFSYVILRKKSDKVFFIIIIIVGVVGVVIVFVIDGSGGVVAIVLFRVVPLPLAFLLVVENFIAFNVALIP